MTEDVEEDGRNPANTVQPAEQQPETPDEEDQLATVDDPIEEQWEQGETQAEEASEERQAEETREEMKTYLHLQRQKKLLNITRRGGPV